MNVDKSHFQVGDAENLLKAMANQGRLMILCEVLKGERTVTELHQAIGTSMSSISQHLAVLRAERIVTPRRESQHVFYSLANDAAEKMLATAS
jgi:ArsR family transcriptional regulator, virulence genes transcriptional regulator